MILKSNTKPDLKVVVGASCRRMNYLHFIFSELEEWKDAKQND